MVVKMQKLYIVENNKQELIKILTKENTFLNNKYFTLNELKKALFYDYDNQTILHLIKKHQLNHQIAKIYLNNLYYIEDKMYQSSKLNQLKNIKTSLLNNNLLKINHLFINYLKNTEVIFYGDFASNDINKIISIIKNYTKVNTIKPHHTKNYLHTINKFSTIEEEILYVANCICQLVKNNVPINKIFLTNLNAEYRLIIKRLFPLFNIPVNLKENISIYSTKIIQDYLSNYPELPSPKLTNDIYEKLISILNNYAFTKDYQIIKPLIIEDLKNTFINKPHLQNAVNEIEFNSIIPQDDCYIFLLNFNQGSIPIIHKDENYLSNQELQELGLLTNIELNNLEKNNTITKIKNIKNLIITFKEKTLNDTYYLSSINDELNYEVIAPDAYNYQNSHLYNKIYLTNLLDNYLKYGTKNSALPTLNNYYSNLPYRKYNNKYQSINSQNLAKYLEKGLVLSYSSMDNYYRCAFRYYLNNILKLNIYEDTFMQTIGNIFHRVLEQIFTQEQDFEQLWFNTLNEQNINYSLKEKFFLKKLKQELIFIIETIKEQNNYSSLKKELHEEKVVINYDGNIKITFKGFIDKIAYKENNGSTIIAIIDYKTGNPNLNLNNVIYGIEMQLPVYIFLSKNIPSLNNVQIAGFYLQKILNNEIIKDNSHSYETLKKKNLLLQGYSNEDTSILSQFDSSYNDSHVIKSLKTSSKGFYPYSKVITNKTMNQLSAIVESKIQEAIENITNANFAINPKQIGKENYGCEFCQFKDICYRQEKDIVKLKEYKNLEFLGGEENAKMD